MTPHLPGDVASPEEGEACQTCGKPATQKVCFEADSFGADYAYLCDEHFEEERNAMRNADTSGVCDWCKKQSDKLFPQRDLEEGSHGAVYSVCRPCIDKLHKSWREELEEDL